MDVIPCCCLRGREIVYLLDASLYLGDMLAKDTCPFDYSIGQSLEQTS